MPRLKEGNGKGEAQKKFPKLHEEEPERRDRSRLLIILFKGFSTAAGYHQMNRDRYDVALSDGVSEDALFRFCQEFLKGSAMPGTDPISDGPKLLRLFQAAESKGLISLGFTKADTFIPEKGK